MISSLLFAFFLSAQIDRPQFDPQLNWRTFKTEHFWIHYPYKLQQAARDLADRAETMWPVQTKRFQWIPSYPVHLVLSDQYDSPNGLSTPLPYNTIYLYPVPPPDDSALDNYDDWMNTLFVHEFTHTLHLDMAKGLNKIPRFILGRFWIPNAAQQQWAHEGLAINYETNETTQGRGRSSFMDMFFRAASLEDAFLGIDRATYFNDVYPYGNSAYYYGIGFHQYVERTYGEDKMTEFAHVTASNPVPSALNFKTKIIFGKSFHRLWEEWRLDEEKKWSLFKQSVKSSFQSKAPEGENWHILGVAAWDSSNQRFFAAVRKKDTVQIREFKKKDSGEFESSVILDDVWAPRLTYVKDHLVYANSARKDRYTSTLDLNVYDLEKKKNFRITRGLRVRDPFVLNGFVYMIHTDGYKSQLVRLPWADVMKSKESEKPIRDLSALEVLYKAEGYDALAKPTGHSQSDEIVFSMKRTNKNRDLYALNLKTKKLRQLTDDPANDYHPQISEDGQTLLYASDHFFPGSKQPVPNLIALNLATGEKSLLTDAITGVSFPAFSKDSIVAGVYNSKGYSLQLIPLNLEKTRALAPEPSNGAETRSFSEGKILSESAYSIGSTLLPRFLAPIFLYTETDVLLGAQTMSYDPLGRHFWTAAAYHRFEPNRPAGFASYIYRGLSWTSLYLSLSSMLTDYGQVLFLGDNVVLAQKYFERSTLLSAGMNIPLSTNESRSNWSLNLSLFGENRQSEFSIPDAVLQGVGDFRGQTDVRLNPETGQTLGVGASLDWARGFKYPTQAFSPSAGQSFSLSVDYTPPVWKADFHTLTTIASGKYFFNPWLDHVVALRLTGGYQWLDVLYLHAFLLGGSLGEGPFSSAIRQSYSLRGLPQSAFRGEGLVVGSLEYRFPLLKRLPGFGTSPLWLKNLHAAVFSDGGQVFTQLQDRLMAYETFSNSIGKRKFSPSRFTVSTGAELRSDISLFYLPPLTFRLGYARVLFLRGDWIGTRSNPLDETYLQAGVSF